MIQRSYVTPTGLAKRKGRPVTQLGSLEAVLKALPDGGVLIVAAGDDGRRRALDHLADAGRSGPGITIITGAGGPLQLQEIAPDTVIGVAPDAFVGVIAPMWADIQRVLATRFKGVIWG